VNVFANFGKSKLKTSSISNIQNIRHFVVQNKLLTKPIFLFDAIPIIKYYNRCLHFSSRGAKTKPHLLSVKQGGKMLEHLRNVYISIF